MSSPYQTSKEVQAIFDEYWPDTEGRPVQSDEKKHEFTRNMKMIQHELIMHYLPKMDSDRVPYALETLKRLEV